MGRRVQRCRSAEVQRCRGAEVHTCRGRGSEDEPLSVSTLHGGVTLDVGKKRYVDVCSMESFVKCSIWGTTSLDKSRAFLLTSPHASHAPHGLSAPPTRAAPLPSLHAAASPPPGRLCLPPLLCLPSLTAVLARKVAPAAPQHHRAMSSGLTGPRPPIPPSLPHHCRPCGAGSTAYASCVCPCSCPLTATATARCASALKCGACSHLHSACAAPHPIPDDTSCHTEVHPCLGLSGLCSGRHLVCLVCRRTLERNAV